jgi:hypothetical protein
MKLIYNFNRSIIVGATRYYLGRMTAAACVFAETLADNWDEIDEDSKSIIIRDIEGAFARDDEARAAGQTELLPLGMDCDRAAWDKVRAKWKAKGSNCVTDLFRKLDLVMAEGNQ